MKTEYRGTQYTGEAVHSPCDVVARCVSRVGGQRLSRQESSRRSLLAMGDPARSSPTPRRMGRSLPLAVETSR